MEIKIGDRVRLHPHPHPSRYAQIHGAVDLSAWEGRQGTVTWVSQNNMIEVRLDGDHGTWWWPTPDVESIA